MTKKSLAWIIGAWVFITIFSYYYLNFFFLALLWIFMSVVLLIVAVIQIIKMIRERNEIKSLRIQKVIVFTMMFLLTFYHSFTHSFIEKIDWFVFYNKRMEVVKMVREGQLNPNVKWNGWVCELPFEFPVISHDGNDIGITRNKEKGTTTVMFWVFRNFFDSPSTYFIYTDDPEKIKQIESRISEHPDGNWKLRQNWYRTYGD